MTDELTCARCGRPIRSGQSTRFVRQSDSPSARIEHFSCPSASPDRDRPPPARPGSADPARRR
jgi:hypothetical protein